MSNHTSIQVDADVFAFLQKHARPFVDTPNDVLRRLLLGVPEDPTSPEVRMPALVSRSEVSVDGFVNELLRQKFGAGFRRRMPYRMMFESTDALVYFQNFNKESDHLWYRITENPWRELQASTTSAWICLSNPAERFAYVLPIAEIQRHVERARWARPYLEVNIDPATSRWTELDWHLDEFFERLQGVSGGK